MKRNQSLIYAALTSYVAVLLGSSLPSRAYTPTNMLSSNKNQIIQRSNPSSQTAPQNVGDIVLYESPADVIPSVWRYDAPDPELRDLLDQPYSQLPDRVKPWMALHGSDLRFNEHEDGTYSVDVIVNSNLDDTSQARVGIKLDKWYFGLQSRVTTRIPLLFDQYDFLRKTRNPRQEILYTLDGDLNIHSSINSGTLHWATDLSGSNISTELIDLLEIHHQDLPSFRDLDYSAPFERIPNTSYGAIAYSRTIVDPELYASRSSFREAFRSGELIAAGWSPDLETPLNPVGTIEESLYLYTPEGIVITGTTKYGDRIVFRGVSLLKGLGGTEIFTDSDQSGRVNRAYDGVSWHHGVPDSVIVDVGTMTTQKATESQERFEEFIMQLNQAVTEYVASNGSR